MLDWIEVFRAGTWTDSQGRTRLWSVEDLDAIAAATSANIGAAGREAPAVVGHPATDDPAYGWVAAVKRDGERLYVRFRDLVPEFVDMVRRQMFPNRSIALNADRSLRHVGFLGAKPPAVKGLAPITHATSDPEAVLEFTAATLKEGLMAEQTFMEKLRQFLGLAKELQIEVPDISLRGGAPAGGAASFTQADIDKARTEARDEALKSGEKAAALAARRARAVTFCAGLKEKGQLLPAWEKAGLLKFMDRLAELEDSITFAEGGQAQSPLAWFEAHLASLPKVINFAEVARAEGAKPTVLSERQREVNKQLGIADDVVEKFAKA